jgi:transcriptional regulator with XRE-family HTH domain
MAGRPPNPIDESTYAGRFAARLRSMRAKRNISVPDLAATLGIAQSTYWNWESGDRQPDLDSIARIAAALGCIPPDLMPRR